MSDATLALEPREDPPVNRIRLVLAGLLTIGISLPVVALLRMPVPFADSQLYASIAIARHVYGVGVPTISWNSPVAVDHIPFYGPVFFDLCAFFLQFFGVTLFTFRLVSVLGTALYVWGTVQLVRNFAPDGHRPLLAAVLALLAPEVSAGAGTGAMHMLAIGFQLCALAAFVRGFDRRRSGRRDAIVAGVLLVLSALTTPRSYPFVFAFLVAATMPGMFGTARRAMRYRLGIVVLTLAAGITAWAIVSHGSVYAWARYLAFIFTHEDTDVAILPTAVRQLSFHPSALLTPTVALAGGMAAAYQLRQRASGRAEATHAALTFLLLCTWIEFIVTTVVLNYTFTIGEYIALPLFSVVLAWPTWPFSRRTALAALALLLTLDGTDFLYRATVVAASWRARDPEAPNRFISRYVPAGSVVVGPEEPFLFPVERNYSRYRTISPRSWADWARWVPIVEPEATAVPRRLPQEQTSQRFLIWADTTLPPGYGCAADEFVARFQPAPPERWMPAWSRELLSPYPGYPPANLYRLPDGCPTGYDPTRAP